MVLFWCGTIGVVGTAHSSTPPAGLSADPNDQATVFVSVMKEDLLSEQLTYPARVVPRTNASVTSETDGMVMKVLVPLGQRVKRGQALVVVQHTDPAYDYAPVVHKAPVAGILSQVAVTPGNRVNRGDVLVSVMDPQNPRILLEVTAADQRQLAAGARGEFVLTAGDSTGVPRKVSVRVKGVSPFVDLGTGTATCEVEADPRQAAELLSLVVPGVLGQASFRTQERKGLLVKESTVRYQGKDPYVRVVEGEKVKFVKVELGRKQRGSVEILKGLAPGAQVIERASRFVAEGDTVKVESEAKSAAGA
ncbi:MAG: efflux RND transporter periplasmic adaptor subunit [Bacteriovoracia bacterium]